MPSSGSWKVPERAGQDHQRRARNGRHSFAGQHQREHHDDLRAQGHMNSGGLRNKHRCQREVKRGAVQIEAVARRKHKADDVFGNPERSMFSSANGSAASLDAVENARMNGCRTAFMNGASGTSAIVRADPKTRTTNSACAR